MPTLYSTVNETGNRNRILGWCKFRFWLVHWIDPRSIEHNYACFLSISCSWYKTQSSARSHHFTVNSTNNRIVLNITVLPYPVRNQFVDSMSWVRVAKNESTQSLRPTVIVKPTTDGIKFNPTQSNPWIDPTHVHLWSVFVKNGQIFYEVM